MPRILIIDDAKDNVSLVKAVLHTNGYEVITAYDAREGYEQLKTHAPDAIVLDLRLPGSDMDGWDFIAFLRSDPSYKLIPIVVTSVEIVPEDRLRALAAGCNAFLGKPFKIGELVRTIASELG